MLSRSLIGVLMVMAVGCAKLPEVKKLTDIKNDTADYVYYALPQTYISISVPVQCVAKNKQPIVSVDKDSTTISTVAVPDTSNIYGIYLRGKYMSDMGAGITQDNNFFLTSATAESANKTFDIMIKVLSGLATVAKSFALASFVDAGDYKLTKNMVTYDIEAMLSGKNPGTAGNDIATLKFRMEMLTAIRDRLARLEDRILEATKVCVVKPEVDPQLGAIAWTRVATISSIKLFWESEKDSLISMKDSSLTIKKVDEPFKSAKTVDDAASKFIDDKNNIYVIIERVGDDFASTIEKKYQASSRDRSYYYRIPGSAKVHVYHGKTLVARSVVPVAQYGVVTSIPGSLKGESASSTFEFDPVTGAIKKLGVTVKAISPEKIQGFIDAGAQFGSLGSDIRLARLQRERELAEEEAKIRAANAPKTTPSP